jgi:hypothetical protein
VIFSSKDDTDGYDQAKLFCWFLHKSRRDGTAGQLVFRHVHTKTRNPNFSTPKNTKIKFASSRIDWSGDSGWLRMGMRSFSLVAWPVNPATVEANSSSWLGIGIRIFLCMHIPSIGSSTSLRMDWYSSRCQTLERHHRSVARDHLPAEFHHYFRHTWIMT